MSDHVNESHIDASAPDDAGNGTTIRLEGVTKTYQSQFDSQSFSLSPASMSIQRGQWSVIQGRSGSGKTTLLHLLAGLDTPDAGRVVAFGSDLAMVSENTRAELLRDRVGLVHQEFMFIEHQTVWQNVSCCLVPTGMPWKTRRAQAMKALARFDMEPFADRQPRELSGGEQQRAALARAIITNPEVIIADEPTSNVDAETGAMVINVFRALCDSGTAIVVATHDEAVAKPAHHRHLMQNGRLTTA